MKITNTLKDFYEKYWEKRIETEGDTSRVSLLRAKIIEKMLPEKIGKVLDVGCGDGTTLNYISSKREYEELHGIEISEKAAKIAKSKGIKCEICNAEDKLPYESEYFDTIICSEVLEHLIFPERVLKEIYRVAKRNATIILSVPNTGYIKYRLKLLAGLSPFEQGRYSSTEHLHFWTKESFQKFLKYNGFEIIEIKGNIGPKIKHLSYYFPSLLSDTLFVRVKKRE